MAACGENTWWRKWGFRRICWKIPSSPLLFSIPLSYFRCSTGKRIRHNSPKQSALDTVFPSYRESFTAHISRAYDQANICTLKGCNAVIKHWKGSLSWYDSNFKQSIFPCREMWKLTTYPLRIKTKMLFHHLIIGTLNNINSIHFCGTFM